MRPGEGVQIADNDHETWKALTALRHAAQCFEQAADMVAKGAPISDPTVQRMVAWGSSQVVGIVRA